MAVGLGISLSLFAAIFKAGKSISTKLGVSAAGVYITSGVYRFISTILFAIALFGVGGWMLPADPVFWSAAILNSIALAATTLLITSAFKISDISVIAPLMAILPVLVTVPAWVLLGQQPTLLSGTGIVLVVVGTYLLEVRSRTDSFLKPLYRLKTDRGAQYIGLMLIIAATVPSIDSIGISVSSPLLWVFTTHFGMSIILLTGMMYKESKWRSDFQTNWKAFVVIGLFNAVLWITQAYAYEVTQVAYVQAIKRSSILLSISAGYLIFEEEHISKRLLGGSIIVCGIIAVILGA